MAWGTECEATHSDIRHLQSTQEDANMKIILHGLDASAQGATQLSIYSPVMFLFWLSDGIQICT